jgi:2-dehydro-3-deoxygluconokinase
MLELVLGAGSDAVLGVAGDTYNTAVYMARGSGRGSVDYITGLGRDGFSDRIRAHMERFGVGAERVFTHPTRIPGLYAIETDDQGERRFTYWRSDAAARSLGDPEMPPIADLFEGLTHLYYSGISLAILPQANRDRLFAAIADFRAQGGVVAFDSNYRPHLWNDRALAQRETTRAWQLCDIGLPSVDDEMALYGDSTEEEVLNRFAGYGIGQGALKRGAVGPIGLDRVVPDLPQTVATVVDTTAAGDSFNAAYLSAVLAGETQTEAMAAGHALAMQVIAQKGAIIFD